MRADRWRRFDGPASLIAGDPIEPANWSTCCREPVESVHVDELIGEEALTHPQPVCTHRCRAGPLLAH